MPQNDLNTTKVNIKNLDGIEEVKEKKKAKLKISIMEIFSREDVEANRTLELLITRTVCLLLFYWYFLQTGLRMPTTVAVVFDNPTAVFFTGQTITGYVQAVCDKPKKCRGEYWRFYICCTTVIYMWLCDPSLNTLGTVFQYYL